jgi:antitoxin PrlF
MRTQELPILSSTATVTSKGQVTIPIEIRKFLELGAGSKVTFLVREGRVELVPAQSIVARTKGMLKTSMPRLSPQEEKVVFEEAMADEAMGRSR